MNILTIGNSFTWSLRRYFPQVVNAAGEKLNIVYMNFGGCELHRHWGYIKAEIDNPKIGVYGGLRMDKTLASTPWDVVTIQQASHASWREETFEPYASNIISFVKEHAPNAKIVIQQTWSYRADHPQFLPNSEWGISQDEMYEKLTTNYVNLAKKYNLDIIPTGLAVQLARVKSPVKFKLYDLAMLDNLTWPDLPPQAGDVVGNIFWKKGADGEMTLGKDLIHLNLRGDYLQACLWLKCLYGINPHDTAKYFIPDEIGNKDAQFLRDIAIQAAETTLG